MLPLASASEHNQKELEFLRIGIKSLKRENESLKQENESLTQENESLTRENESLKQILKQENECQRGVSSIMLQKVLKFVNKLIIYILPLFKCR